MNVGGYVTGNATLMGRIKTLQREVAEKVLGFESQSDHLQRITTSKYYVGETSDKRAAFFQGKFDAYELKAHSKLNESSVILTPEGIEAAKKSGMSPEEYQKFIADRQR